VVGYLLLVLMAGPVDSPLVPALPDGVHPAGWIVRAAEWIGLSRLTRTQLVVLSLGVIAAALAAFLALLWEAWRGRVRFVAVMVAVALGVGLAVAAPLLLSRDVHSYAAYGRILAVHGSNPYVHPPSAFPGDPFVAVASPEWIDTRSVYGPAFTLLSAGIARAWSGSPASTIMAFKAVAGASIIGAALLAARGVRSSGRGRDAAAAAMVGLNPVIVLHTVGGGHNDALVALCFAGAFALGAHRSRPVDPRSGGGGSGREAVVTGLLTVAVLVKAVVAPLLILWLWQAWRATPGRARTVRALFHAVVIAALTIAAFVPVASGWSTVRALLSVTSRQGWASGPGLAARGAQALGRAVGGSATGAFLDAAASAAFVLLFLVVFWRVLRRIGPVPDGNGWGGSMLLLALAAPYLLPWYAAWFVPFLAAMEDAVLVVAGLAVSALLALTGIPAEPSSTPAVWEGMLLAVHYVAAPVMLALLGVVASRMGRPGRSARLAR
jgi:alpha-1,6-mannosyltransferase